MYNQNSFNFFFFFCRILKTILYINSFTKPRFTVLRSKKKIFFNFFFVFYFLNSISRPNIIVLKKTQNKAVLLKSPFHYKVFKYNIGYSYYNIKISFFVFSEIFHLFKKRLLGLITLFRIKKIQYKTIYSFKLKNLLL